MLRLRTSPMYAIRMSASVIVIYAAAALAEIAGCFAFWAWLRNGQSAWWVLPGIASLIAFAWLLTLAPTAAAGNGTWTQLQLFSSIARLYTGFFQYQH